MGSRRAAIFARSSRQPASARATPFGIAARENAGKLRALLEDAWKNEILGSARAQTAKLYAELVICGAFAFPWVVERPAHLMLRAFEAAGSDFAQIFAHHLLRGLARERRLRLLVGAERGEALLSAGGLQEEALRVASSLAPPLGTPR
jgi:hypothetical protein